MTPEPAQNVRGTIEVFRGEEARQATAPAPVAGAESLGLFPSVLAVTGKGEGLALLDRFLAEASPARAIALWAGRAMKDTADLRGMADRLQRDVARLDAILSAQANAILHHPRFQRLEASWRGLRYLVDTADDAEGVKIRVLNAGWKEIARDLERAIEFDQSQLFRKVYSEEFGMPGGEPYGLLLTDCEIRPRPSAEHPLDDIAVLASLSQVAAAAFVPVIAGTHPAMFGLDDFSELEQPLNLTRAFDQLEYVKWKAFRESEDSRFVGLTLPRVLMRLPYEDDGSRVDGFRFREDVEGPGRKNYLWGNAVYAFGAVVVRAFLESGWLAGIAGVRCDVAGGGLLNDLPVHSFSTDKRGIATKCSTDIMVSDFQEQELSELGFIPLCHCENTDYSAFYTTPSVQKSKKYDELAATINARISAMLQYMLCVSRFAHYLKVLVRDKIGSFTEADECENFLHKWIHQYVVADPSASPEVKAEYPLREARIRVWEHPGKPGSYLCTAHLWPHFELDGLTASVRVMTELVPTAKP